MFFLRLAFWMLVVVALIPVDEALLESDQQAISTYETIGAAQAAITDLAAFCERNPQACETGREIFSQLGAKARTGIGHINDYLDTQFAENQTPAANGQPDATLTGSVSQ